MKFKLKNPFAAKAQNTYTIGLKDKFIPIEFSRSLSYSFGEGSPLEYVNEGYAENPFFFAVIDKIAQKVATLPRDFFNPDNPKEPIRPNVNYLELLKNPNPLMNQYDLYYSLTVNWLSQGEAFIHALQAIGLSNAFELLIPRPPVVVVNDMSGTIKDYSYTLHGKSYTGIQPDEMLHFYRHNMAYDSMRGLSALRSGRKVYKADNELREAKASIYENRGASGVLYGKGNHPMTPTEREQLQNYYDNQTGGNNRDKRYIASTELGHIPLGMDGNMIRGLQNEGLENLRDACRLFHYPSVLMGDTSAMTYNNLSEAKTEAMYNAILPVAYMIDKNLSEFLLQGKLGSNNVYYLPDESLIDELQTTNKEEAETLKIDIEAGILTVNEARAMRYPSLPPLPENNQNNEPEE